MIMKAMEPPSDEFPLDTRFHTPQIYRNQQSPERRNYTASGAIDDRLQIIDEREELDRRRSSRKNLRIDSPESYTYQ